MADPQFKARVLAADAAQRDDSKLGGRVIDAFARMFELGDPPDYEPDAGVEHRAPAPRARVASALDLAYDVLLRRRRPSRSCTCRSSTTPTATSTRWARCSRTPTPSSGSADGGAHLGTICDASFPTTLLTLWARDRDRGRLDLPFAVQRHTSATARTVGLLDRGVLAPGYRADVNVIDFERLTRPPAGDAPRSARRRQAPRAAGRRLRRHAGRRRGHLRERRDARPAAGPARPRPASGTGH